MGSRLRARASRARLRAALAGGLLLLATACTGLPLRGAPAPEWLDRTGGAAVPDPPPRTVVLVSVDGLAPWVLASTETPRLDALAAGGTSAERAETVVPSRTLPSHTSMLSGLAPARHGVDWNDWRPGRRIEVPTVFSVCRRARLRCGLFAGKRKFAHFAVDEPGVEQYAYAPRAEAVLGRALAYLEARHPHFVMIHLAEVDAAGHWWRWGSGQQRAQIRRIDEDLGRFLDEAGERYDGRLSVIVTADHGGHGWRHGGAGERDVRIPWIAWGDGVPAGGHLAFVRTVDTAPTILGLLGRVAPGGWLGASRFPFATDGGFVDVGAVGGGR